MTTLAEIIEAFHSRYRHYSEIVDSLHYGNKIYQQEIIHELHNVIRNKDARTLECLITVAYDDGGDHEYTDILCTLLKSDWHYSHEEIVMLMEDIMDPNSVDCLFETANYKIESDYLKSLPQKCIWALGAINTPEAREKLKLLSESDDEIIRERALIQLRALQQ